MVAALSSLARSVSRWVSRWNRSFATPRAKVPSSCKLGADPRPLGNRPHLSKVNVGRTSPITQSTHVRQRSSSRFTLLTVRGLASNSRRLRKGTATFQVNLGSTSPVTQSVHVRQISCSSSSRVPLFLVLGLASNSKKFRQGTPPCWKRHRPARRRNVREVRFQFGQWRSWSGRRTICLCHC